MVHISGKMYSLMSFTIEVEKRLCKILGREWKPEGMSIESLSQDIEKELQLSKMFHSLAEIIVSHGQGKKNETGESDLDEVNNFIELLGQAFEHHSSSSKGKKPSGSQTTS